jgi:hypothetical protein
LKRIVSTKAAAVALSGLALGIVALPAAAHHAIQPIVDTGRVVESEMILTKLDWINPHSWFHFSLRRGEGTVIVVPIEGDGLAGLRRAGYTRPDEFTIGQAYRVRYFPNRDGTPGGALVTMTNLATGRVYDED